MRTPDTRVLATVVFCCLGALAIGCAESSKKTSADAAVDTGASDFAASPDTASDSAEPHPSPDVPTDAIPQDLSPDVSVDAASADATQLDGLQGSEAGDDSRGDSAVPTTMATITFRFKNTGPSTLYVHQGCTIFVRVTSIADGTTYGTNYACACTCASPSCNGSLACGACAPPSGVPIEFGAAKEIVWVAQSTTSQLKTGPYGSFQCENHSPIPTGPYKVEILVYADSPDATSETNSHKVEKDFTLETADATVEVPIQ